MRCNKKQILGTTILTALTIVLYFFYLRKVHPDDMAEFDPLNKKVISLAFISPNCCSWWPVSHFIYFFLAYLIWPDCGWELFSLGVIWEFIEGIINWLETRKGEEVKHQTTRGENGLEYVTWWSASKKDILFNGAGLLAGYYARPFLKSKGFL